MILYPKQNYYGENIKVIYHKYSNIGDIITNIKNNKEKYKENYWLYEILFIQVEFVIKKKIKKYTMLK